LKDGIVEDGLTSKGMLFQTVDEADDLTNKRLKEDHQSTCAMGRDPTIDCRSEESRLPSVKELIRLNYRKSFQTDC